MSWFKEWFNTPYYHLLYKNRDFSEAESFIDNLIDYLAPVKEAKVLDLACGKGRHSIYLNKKGFQVSGVDLSNESILAASESRSSSLNFDVHDMREVYAAATFDYVFNLFTSFGYFDEDAEDIKVLAAVNQNLRTSGLLVLDYLNAEKVVVDLLPQQVIHREGVDFSISKKVVSGFVVKGIDFEDKGEHYSYQERVKLLTLPKFQEYLSLTNFKLLATFGDYKLGAFDPLTSPRLILIAQKVG